jgi:DNA phosphorothioation-associated putative methyltransferase
VEAITLRSYGAELPEEGEFDAHERLLVAVGSMARAHRLLCSATDASAWEGVREARSEDLLVYLALAKFDGRPALGELPLDMRRDVKAFFRSYARAFATADELLYSIGGDRSSERRRRVLAARQATADRALRPRRRCLVAAAAAPAL